MHLPQRRRQSASARVIAQLRRIWFTRNPRRSPACLRIRQVFGDFRKHVSPGLSAGRLNEKDSIRTTRVLAVCCCPSPNDAQPGISRNLITAQPSGIKISMATSSLWTICYAVSRRALLVRQPSRILTVLLFFATQMHTGIVMAACTW